MIHEDILESVLNDIHSNLKLTVCLSSYPRKSPTPVYQTLNIKQAVIDEFRSIVEGHCQEITDQKEGNGLQLQAFNMSITQIAPDELEWLDFTLHSNMVDHTNAITSSVHFPPFKKDPDFLRYLHSYAIMLETADEPIIFYRKYNPRRELTRGPRLAIFDADGQYDKVRETTFTLDRKIDCFSRGNHIFITAKREFQSIFRWYEVLRDAAKASLEQIRVSVPISNFADFAARCEKDIDTLVKVNSITSKPYINTLTIEDIKQVISAFGITGVKITVVDGKEVLVYDESDPLVILKILDDDYLQSDMTSRKYVSSAKRDLA